MKTFTSFLDRPEKKFSQGVIPRLDRGIHRDLDAPISPEHDILYISNCRGKKTEGGFTLLEVLIASALLAIIMTALYSTFFLSRRAIDGLDESLVKLQESRNVLDVIGREAESLLYRQTNTHSFFSLEDRDIYGKQTSRLSFTAYSPLTYGLSAISYYVEEKGGVLTLYKKMENPYKPDETVKGVELIDGIGAFSVEVKQGDAWVKTWDTKETGNAPADIRITLTVMLKDRPVSLFETVRPMIGGAL